MFRDTLEQRVTAGIAALSEGEQVTAWTVANAEGVSKSPQLFSILNSLVETGVLTKRIDPLPNGMSVHVFIRTGRHQTGQLPGFGSKAGGV